MSSVTKGRKSRPALQSMLRIEHMTSDANPSRQNLTAVENIGTKHTDTGLQEAEENAPETWVQLYRQGIGGAEVARICGEPDVLAVLRHLTAAKRVDASLESRHLAGLVTRAREVQEELASKRAITSAWRRRLDELSAFVREHGCMPRQTGGDEAETGLGRWLHAQRSKVAKGTLQPRQRAALDAIGAWDSDRRAGRGPIASRRRYCPQQDGRRSAKPARQAVRRCRVPA